MQPHRMMARPWDPSLTRELQGAGASTVVDIGDSGPGRSINSGAVTLELTSPGSTGSHPPLKGDEVQEDTLS
jgi:hypothetical protein